MCESDVRIMIHCLGVLGLLVFTYGSFVHSNGTYAAASPIMISGAIGVAAWAVSAALLQKSQS